MLRFLADENLNRNILRGVARAAALDFVRAQEVGLGGCADSQLLEWAAENQRIIVSHDVNTLPMFAWQRVAEGRIMPGILLVPPSLAMTTVIEDLILVAETCQESELEDQVWYLPLR